MKKKQYPKKLLLNVLQMKALYTTLFPKDLAQDLLRVGKKQLQWHEMNKRYIQLSESFEDG